MTVLLKWFFMLNLKLGGTSAFLLTYPVNVSTVFNTFYPIFFWHLVTFFCLTLIQIFTVLEDPCTKCTNRVHPASGSWYFIFNDSAMVNEQIVLALIAKFKVYYIFTNIYYSNVYWPGWMVVHFEFSMAPFLLRYCKIESPIK